MKRIIVLTLAPIFSACASLGNEYVSQTNQTAPPSTGTTTTEITTETTTSQPSLDNDNDGFSIKEGDCDDNDATINPDATEYCDGIDSDCSGSESSGIVSFYNTAENKWYDRTNNLTGDANAPSSQSLTDSGDYHFCEGTFYVSLFVANDISLIGEYGEVFLDGADLEQVIINANGFNLDIRNLVIQNGAQPSLQGGGLYQSEGTLRLTDVDFFSNSADAGGALAVWDATTVLENVSFYQNLASTGGAVGVYNGTYVSSDTRYIENAAENAGALYAYYTNISEASPNYEGNAAADTAGAVYSIGAVYEAYDQADGATAQDCTFRNNSAPFGGVWRGFISTLSLNDCDLINETDALDNSTHDIYVADNGFFYNYEAQTSVTCDATGCGNATGYSILAKSPSEYNISPTSIIGNTYLSQTIDTIDTFSYYIKSQIACTPTFTVHEKTADADWAQIWEGQSGTTNDLSFSYVGAGDVGVPTVPGNEYLLGISNGDSCGLLFFFWGGDKSIPDAGFGDLTGYAFQINWDTAIGISTYTTGIYNTSVTSSH
jgi:hypothetical protein